MNPKWSGLSPSEKEELLRFRREHGYPLYAPPHPIREEGYYLITAACYQHQNILFDPSRRTGFESRLLGSLEEIQAEIVAWAILPDHYHMLVGIQLMDSLSTMLRHFHGSTSYEWNRLDGMTGKRRVWYKFFDRMIRSENHYFQAINYIHANSFKHGWVSSPYDWPWSSLGMYEELRGREWLRETWRKYPPEDSSHEWGE
jgi:putative transposase